MFPNTDTADPHASANRYRARARACRRAIERRKEAWGRFALIEAHGGPHTLAVLRQHPEYRRIRALIEEAKFWDGAARRMASLHASHGHYRTWAAPVCHTDLPEQVYAESPKGAAK